MRYLVFCFFHSKNSQREKKNYKLLDENRVQVNYSKMVSFMLVKTTDSCDCKSAPECFHLQLLGLSLSSCPGSLTLVCNCCCLTLNSVAPSPVYEGTELPHRSVL